MVEDLRINADDITMEAELAGDLGINSLELADLVYSCEEKFDITIDEVRFNTTLSDDFADALAQLNDSENNPTQADIDTLTQQLIWNLRWHVSEG